MPLISSLVCWTRLRKKISQVKDMSVETSKTEKQREKILKKNRIEYSRTVGQIQKA